MNDRYDVVVMGAGMVGSVLACALADIGQRVALIDNQENLVKPPEKDEVPRLRVSAISVANMIFLENLGIWQLMDAERHCAYQEMQVWDSEGGGRLHFDSADVPWPRLGTIIENDAIHGAALSMVKHLNKVDLLLGQSVESVTWLADTVKVQLASGQRLQAGLIVGADGARSQLRQLANIQTDQHAYYQRGLVTTVDHERPHCHTAWQRFMTTGPVALLPLHTGQSSIVWTTSDEQAEELLALDDVAFCEHLTEATEGCLGGILGCGKRAAFPLQYLHTKQYVRPRLALVGDAAHVIHPLAGLGVNLGFQDVACLTEVIVDACAQKRDPGHVSVLRRYERWRRAENLPIAKLLDTFYRVFGSENSLLKRLRNVALDVPGKMPFLKRRLMTHAMGLTGDRPRLSRRVKR